VLKETDPDELTDFLVIAAKLILIKSEVLLPRPPPILIEEDEEDVGDELARQLILYKKFKEAAADLKEIEDLHRRSFVRVNPKVKIEAKLLPGEGNLAGLIQAARHIMAIKAADPHVDEVVSPQVVTIGQQMVRIWEEVSGSNEPVVFQRLLHHTSNRIEVIVTLLAILEMVKRRLVMVDQTDRFGEIYIYRKAGGQSLADADWDELLGMTDIS
jgi:segregation and condensation protein A